MKSLYLLLTDQCNMNCSFCYKEHVTKAATRESMSFSLAKKIIESAIDGELFDPSGSDSSIFFWGGEPFIVADVIKELLEEYQQIRFTTTTNGLAIDKELADFLFKHRYHFTLTLSLGSAYDMFDGVEDALKRLAPIVEKVVASDWKWGVNFVVSKPENLYADFLILHAAGVHNVKIDMPTHCEITKEYRESFVFNYLRILEDFNINKKHDGPIFDGRAIKECGMEKKQYRYCGSGVDRILVDFRGDVYPCDGLCYAKTAKIGNINEGIEYEKLEFFQKLKDDPKPFYESCKECEIETECPRAKCMGINLLLTGNMFTPEKNWCEIAKTFHEIGLKYEKFKKLKSQKEKVEAYV